MKKRAFLILLTIGVVLGGFLSLRSPLRSVPLMPLPVEFTSLWWKEGFPGLVEGAPWEQCIETGLYGFVFDTKELHFPHFGPLAGGGSLEGLAPADLDIQLEIDGKSYRAIQGGEWSRFTGPRLIASGTFLQRFDVTDLLFESDDGSRPNIESRLELVAWHDRLSILFFARPGESPLLTGRSSFGKVGGGFGLDGTNRFEIPAKAIPNPQVFSLSFHVFLPTDFQPTEIAPWLFCKGGNELADGNLGVILNRDGLPRVRINRGGGRSNAIELAPGHRRTLQIGRWNHLLFSYDGTQLKFFLNGSLFAEETFDTAAPLASTPITFGQRGDGFGNGYPFRGVIDEIQLYTKVVDPAMILNRSAGIPAAEWGFDPNGRALEKRPRETWASGKAVLTLKQANEDRLAALPLSAGENWTEVILPIDPVDLSVPPEPAGVIVTATEMKSGTPREVIHDPAKGWHRINLDGVEPISPDPEEKPSHDAIERIRLTLSNPGDSEDRVRLIFEKTAGGFRQRIGSPITGLSAILRNPDGYPTGIPVQLSKNWHNHPEGGDHSGQWFHGITQVRLPPGTTRELELTICYGHWGGIPAASHAQLCLIGWGSNQRWDQSALGSWGESVCYEPDQVQGKCSITDVRPFLVRPMDGGDQPNWTVNVGGGDFFRLFDPEGSRIPHVAMKADYLRYGPCLTEVRYSGRLESGIFHSRTVSIARSRDLLRATYRIRMEVREPCDFSRFVVFQVGADTYNKTHERLFAVGNEEGLHSQWQTERGGGKYRRDPIRLAGEIPWVSMHEGEPLDGTPSRGAWANRGLVIRSWNAQLGGQSADPWFAEYGNEARGAPSSTADIVPPPGLTKLLPGDFVEATIEHLILPQNREDYLGADQALRAALENHGNSWKMVEREARENNRVVATDLGDLIHRYPDIRINTRKGQFSFTVEGGLGHVPVTMTGLSHPDRGQLSLNGIPMDQSVHGNDFWQTNYDSESKTWSRTYNVRIPDKGAARITFR